MADNEKKPVMTNAITHKEIYNTNASGDHPDRWTEGSIVGQLNDVAVMLIHSQPMLGYENLASRMEALPEKVRPVNYVMLLAEAMLAGVGADKVIDRFPDAKCQAQNLKDHMTEFHKHVLKTIPFIFDSSPESTTPARDDGYNADASGAKIEKNNLGKQQKPSL